MGIKLKVWGKYACFTRPEMKVERVSYDVITPSAARGILSSIYWKPAIEWVIDKIHVINPIKFDNLRRNEVGKKASINLSKIQRVLETGEPLEIDINKHRQQRASMVLKDVCYYIEAHFEVIEGDNPQKHFEMFKRRAKKGQCVYQPYLGCREFVSYFQYVDDIPKSQLIGIKDLGIMLHSMDYSNLKNIKPKFFHPILEDGIIKVPHPKSSEVK